VCGGSQARAHPLASLAPLPRRSFFRGLSLRSLPLLELAREEPLRRDADAASEPDLEERRRDDFTGASALGLSFRKDSLSTAESPITAPRRRAIAGWRSSSEPIATRGLVSYLRPHHSQKQPVTTILPVTVCWASCIATPRIIHDCVSGSIRMTGSAGD